MPAGKTTVIFTTVAIMSLLAIIGLMWHKMRAQNKIRNRQEVASHGHLHAHYMTVADRLAIRQQVNDQAFPDPSDSTVTMSIGKNRGYTLETRIGSRSKYASSFKGHTDSMIPFAVRVYAVPIKDRSKIERSGIDAAERLLLREATGSMPVVYRCYHSTHCTLAKPFNGPNTGFCHIIVNELANMDGEQWMKSGPSLEQVQTVSFQIVQGMYALLQENIRHGDVKASNVLIFKEPVASPSCQVYHIGGEAYYVPWTGVRATLWDFEFVKPVDRKEPVTETLDVMKFLKEMIFYYIQLPGRDNDEVVTYLQKMKNLLQRNQGKPLTWFIPRFFWEFNSKPESHTVLEVFTC